MKKVISIFIFFGVVMLSFDVKSQLIGHLKGNFILAFCDNSAWSTNNYSVDIESAATNWHLTILSQNYHEEVFATSNQTEDVIYYDKVVPTQKGLNTAEVKLFSSSRPHSSRIAEHIWVALFSRNTFAGKSQPINDIGLCIEESCVFTEFEINSNETSPRRAVWHNERSDKYKGQTRINGSFQWLEQTNMQQIPQDVIFPVKSEMSVSGFTRTGHSAFGSYSKLIITNVGALLNSPPEIASIRGRAPIYDYRVKKPSTENKGMDERAYVTYNSHDGSIPYIKSSIVEAAKEHNPVYKEPTNQLKKQVVASVVLGFSIITFFAIWYATKTRNNNKSK